MKTNEVKWVRRDKHRCTTYAIILRKKVCDVTACVMNCLLFYHYWTNKQWRFSTLITCGSLYYCVPVFKLTIQSSTVHSGKVVRNCLSLHSKRFENCFCIGQSKKRQNQQASRVIWQLNKTHWNTEIRLSSDRFSKYSLTSKKTFSSVVFSSQLILSYKRLEMYAVRFYYYASNKLMFSLNFFESARFFALLRGSKKSSVVLAG